jgi:hypothetical protein
MLREKPPPGQEDGFSEMSSAGCFDNSEIKPPRQNTQIKFQDPAALEVNARFKKFPQDWLAAYDLSDPEDLAQLQQASDTVAANPDMKYEFVNELTIRNVRLKPVKVVESKIGEFTTEQCYGLLEDIFDFAYGLGHGEAIVMVAETRRSFENEVKASMKYANSRATNLRSSERTLSAASPMNLPTAWCLCWGNIAVRSPRSMMMRPWGASHDGRQSKCRRAPRHMLRRIPRCTRHAR